MKTRKITIEWTGYADDAMIADYQESYNDSQDEADKITVEQAREMIYEDSDYWQNEWDSFTEYLTELMSNNCYWRDDASRMGWTSRTGYKVFKAENGNDFILAISPNTDCHYIITKHYKGFKIRISHHDAPMGEYHTVKPTTLKEYEENV